MMGADRSALCGICLSLQCLEEDVELVGDAGICALTLRGQRELNSLIAQAQRLQNVCCVLSQEAATNDSARQMSGRAGKHESHGMWHFALNSAQ